MNEDQFLDSLMMWSKVKEYSDSISHFAMRALKVMCVSKEDIERVYQTSLELAAELKIVQDSFLENSPMPSPLSIIPPNHQPQSDPTSLLTESSTNQLPLRTSSEHLHQNHQHNNAPSSPSSSGPHSQPIPVHSSSSQPPHISSHPHSHSSSIPSTPPSMASLSSHQHPNMNPHGLSQIISMSPGGGANLSQSTPPGTLLMNGNEKRKVALIAPAPTHSTPPVNLGLNTYFMPYYPTYLSSDGNNSSLMGSPLNIPTKKRRRGRVPANKTNLVCQKCGTSDTPEWRRGPEGSNTLCNACGLQYAKKQKKEKEEKPNHSGIDMILNNGVQIHRGEES
eukprot:TRINITY_DN8869_c0_g1_i1.p1 TRINITY_DN8869_c0_g1~~TRINITY_DN8869_c0_g1_i1.p1  ORF type:complete len:336 (-),score=71.80 TRINITY_DN8869_c0_g1_i1:27-1034(-)